MSTCYSLNNHIQRLSIVSFNFWDYEILSKPELIIGGLAILKSKQVANGMMINPFEGLSFRKSIPDRLSKRVKHWYERTKSKLVWYPVDKLYASSDNENANGETSCGGYLIKKAGEKLNSQ
jgi:hypothetical protein